MIPARSSALQCSTRQWSRRLATSIRTQSLALQPMTAVARMPTASYSQPFSSSSSSPAPTPASSVSAAETTNNKNDAADHKLPDPAPALFITTRHEIAGRVIVKDLGLVAASAFRSRNLFIDVLVAVTRIFGGETPDYTVLLNECTEKATQRLEATARAAGATSVVGVRFASTTTMNRMIVGLHCSVLATGTAVIDVDVNDPRAQAILKQRNSSQS